MSGTSRPGNRLALDRHVVMTLAYRSWQVIAGGLTVLTIAWFLTSAEQGYYFTFASVLALQIFFELGLNIVVMQITSHAVAHLSVGDDGAISGPAKHRDRITRFVAILRKWFTLAAILFFVLAGTGGAMFFLLSNAGLDWTVWLWPWLAAVAGTTITLRLSPMLAVAQGLGHVSRVATLQLWQSFAGYVGLWLALALGAGLWAVAVVPWVAAIASSVWLARRDRLRPEVRGRDADAISWRRDVLPMQWRMALSWASGYFIFQLFTPVVFARHGAEEAGRLGLALSIFSSILAVGMSWVEAKMPAFGMHISRRESRQLNDLWRRVATWSTIVVAVASVLVVLVVWGALGLGIPLAERISPPVDLVPLAAVAILNTIISACAMYMRAHVAEPLVLQSVVTAIAIAIIVIVIPDVTWMLYAYALVALLIALPWVIVAFRKYWRGHRETVALDSK